MAESSKDPEGVRGDSDGCRTRMKDEERETWPEEEELGRTNGTERWQTARLLTGKGESKTRAAGWRQSPRSVPDTRWAASGKTSRLCLSRGGKVSGARGRRGTRYLRLNRGPPVPNRPGPSAPGRPAPSGPKGASWLLHRSRWGH